MIAAARVLLILAPLIVGAGCSKREDAPASPPENAPATRSLDLPPIVAAPPTSQPRPVPAVIRMGETRVEFPPASLRVESIDGKVIAHLTCSGSGAVNTLDLQMDLDADTVREFAESEWRYTISPHELPDSPYGIFLDNGRRQLQPLDVKATFEPTSSTVTLIAISGQFLLSDSSDPTVPAQTVAVVAEISARTTVKE